MKKRQARYILTFVFLLFLIAIRGQKTSPSIAPTPTVSPVPTSILGATIVTASPSATLETLVTATVVKVVDGDTIQVTINGIRETIRILGIDTPETVDPRQPVECFGKEASERAKELLPVGKTVKLEQDYSQSNRDRYGRLLRYVSIEGKDYGKQMIEEGYAYEYTYDNPYKYQQDYKNAQYFAQQNKRGLWGDNLCQSVL